jgi:predicted small metal-binding protein
MHVKQCHQMESLSPEMTAKVNAAIKTVTVNV